LKKYKKSGKNNVIKTYLDKKIKKQKNRLPIAEKAVHIIKS